MRRKCFVRRGLLLPFCAVIALVLPTIAGAEAVQGKVFNKDQQPVPNVFVYVVQNVMDADKSFVTRVDGTYLIENVSPGSYDLHFAKDGYEYRLVKGVVVQEGQTTTVDIGDLAVEAKITGKVVNSVTSTGIPDILVTADNGAGLPLVALTDANGAYELNRLPAGTFSITAFELGFSFSPLENIKVSAGDTLSGLDLRPVPWNGLR
jgi:hypothetical protein